VGDTLLVGILAKGIQSGLVARQAIGPKIGAQDASLRGLVKDVYLNNLQGN
jgi:hypothetical protein